MDRMEMVAELPGDSVASGWCCLFLLFVRRLKSEDGPDLILWGSSTLTSVLLEQGLVDEVLLFVYPVLLGLGKRFFSDNADPRALALVSTKALSSGVLVNTYRHIGSLPTESPAGASG